MATTLILNSNNKVTPSKYEYVFPSNVKFDKGDKLGLQSISMYNSIFNIEAQRGNNRLSIIWNADTSVQYDILIPDGFYDVTALKYYIFNFMVLNNLYLVDANGNNIYFIEIVTKPAEYAVQLNVYALPTAAEMTTLELSYPTVHLWSAPTVATTPQLIIPSQSFGNLIGFNLGTFPAAPIAENIQLISIKTPQISPVNCILLGCNLISSMYSNPSNLFYSVPIKAGFGNMISETNTSLIYNQIASGNYGKIVIEFYDQGFNSLRLHDEEITIVLSILKG